MAQFVYLYRRSGRPAASPEQMQQNMQRWQTWLKQLADQGHLIDRGLPLELTGTRVGRGSKSDITDGPYAEKDLVMGFSLIEARDLLQASELSASCPIIDDTGGAVEIRPVMPM